jgi:autotransporter-associated beta strand protein
MKRTALLRSLGLVGAIVAAVPVKAGKHVWTGAGANNNWSLPANWQGNTPPVSGEAAPVTLWFPPGAARIANVNDIGGLVVDEIFLTGSGYRLDGAGQGGSLALRGFTLFLFTPTVVNCTGDQCVIGGGLSLVLNDDVNFSVAPGAKLTVLSSISGPGGVSKDGLGPLYFSGVYDNTYAGATHVDEGVLGLNCGSVLNLLHPVWLSSIAVPGPLTIGTSNVMTAAGVTLFAPDQLSPNQPVVVNANGDFRLNGKTQTIGSLTMTGGYVEMDLNNMETNFGTLTLNGDLIANASPYNNGGISGNIALGGTNRTFTINAPSFTINAQISDGWAPAGVTKNGAGRLALLENSTFTGPMVVNAGAVESDAYESLGDDSAPLVVNAGGQVEINTQNNFNSVVYTRKPLTLAGHGTGTDAGALIPHLEVSFYGPVTFAEDATIFAPTDSDRLTLYGEVGGPGGVTLAGAGHLTFAGQTPNTYGGSTHVPSGQLLLGKPFNVTAVPGPLTVGVAGGSAGGASVTWLNLHQVADSSPVTVNDSGILNLNSQGDTVGSMNGSGQVILGTGFLDIGADNSSMVFSGQINGGGDSLLVKLGSGGLKLSGSGSTVHEMTLEQGPVQIDGQWTQASVLVEGGATLSGTATLSKIDNYAVVTPGDDGPGRLTALDITFEGGSAFVVKLGGIQPGVDFDQLVGINSAALSLAPVNLQVVLEPGFSGSPGQTYTILRNDSPSATGPVAFANLPEGSNLTLTNGVQFQITYKGGDGNDVILTQLVNAPAQLVNPKLMAGGSLSISGKGAPLATYTLQATGNLGDSTSWVNVSSAKAGADGTFLLMDTTSRRQQHQFYRAVSQ